MSTTRLSDNHNPNGPGFNHGSPPTIEESAARIADLLGELVIELKSLRGTGNGYKSPAAPYAAPSSTRGGAPPARPPGSGRTPDGNGDADGAPAWTQDRRWLEVAREAHA